MRAVKVIYRGKMLYKGEIREGCIVIEDGVIVDVHGLALNNNDADVVLNYEGRPGAVALPAFMDIHVHLRGLELSYKEDEETGTRAAAKGGYAIVFDMPNTKPELRTVSAVRDKLAALKSKALVDYGVYAGVPHNIREDVLGEPVIGLKVYPEDYENPCLESAVFEASRRGKLVVVHPEEPNLFVEVEEKPGERWLSRPMEAELAGVEFAAKLVMLGAKVHVTHVTCRESVELAKKYRLTCDTCPHYLLLDSEYERKLRCYAKVNPPLRPPHVKWSLLEALIEGAVDAVTTDHAPHAKWEKEESFDSCPSGIPSLEVASRLMLTLVSRGVLTLDDVARLMSYNPARIAGLKGVGEIKRGYKGNIVVVDMSSTGRISLELLESKAGYTPYEGWPYRGEPVVLLVRGEPILIEGEIHGKPGYGVNVCTAYA